MHYQKSINFPHTFIKKTVTTKWAKSMKKRNFSTFDGELSYAFWCGTELLHFVGNLQCHSGWLLHSMYKIKPRQFISRFRKINMVKCDKDVSDFNPISITTSNKCFLQTSLLSTLHINLAQKKCIISRDFEVRMLYLQTQRSQYLLTKH